MEFTPADLILRRRVAPSRKMDAGTISVVAVLRDADLRSAPQDEADDADMIRTSETLN
jgi:hypothetical protein